LAEAIQAERSVLLAWIASSRARVLRTTQALLAMTHQYLDEIRAKTEAAFSA
jgi:hypothetical protein